MGSSYYIGIPVVEVERRQPLSPAVFYDLADMIGEPADGIYRVSMNPRDLRDIYVWDVNVTGWMFRERYLDGELFLQFGEFIFDRAWSQPEGVVTMYGRTKGFIVKK